MADSPNFLGIGHVVIRRSWHVAWTMG